MQLLILADEILADCSQNRQSAKINSPPKFPAIRYIHIYIYIIGSETMGAQEERAPTSFIMRGGHKFSNWTLKENL